MYLTKGKQVEVSCKNQQSNFSCFLVKLPTALILLSLESLYSFLNSELLESGDDVIQLSC